VSESISNNIKAVIPFAVGLISALGQWYLTGEINAAEISSALVGLVAGIITLLVPTYEGAAKAIATGATGLVAALILALVTGVSDKAAIVAGLNTLLSAILVYFASEAPRSTAKPSPFSRGA
jgi:hypothetical protein